MANTKKRKKRVKRQLKRRTKQTAAGIVFSFRQIEDLRKEEQAMLYQERENALIKRTEEYQLQLDKIYGGTVKLMTRYLNDKAILQYKCSKCNGTFFDRPSYQLKQDSSIHVCGGSSRQYKANAKAVNKVLTKDKAEMVKLHKEGLSYRQIAEKFSISHSTVRKYIKEMLSS